MHIKTYWSDVKSGGEALARYDIKRSENGVGTSTVKHSMSEIDSTNDIIFSIHSAQEQ